MTSPITNLDFEYIYSPKSVIICPSVLRFRDSVDIISPFILMDICLCFFSGHLRYFVRSEDKSYGFNPFPYVLK